MSVNRRKFINRLGKAAGTLSFATFLNPTLARSLEEAFQKASLLSLEACTTDETFWRQIRLAYSISSTILDLNNGGVSPQAKVVQEAFEHYNRLCNEAPSYYMWRRLDRRKEVIRQKLADFASCSKDSVAITRNASESLEAVIFGLQLKAGDEVILSKQGYPNMINAWKQRELRDGIVLRWLDFELPQESKVYFTQKYQEAFTKKTKLVHITHVINWNGQVLPVREIADLAHENDIEVLVDGAHSFAQMDYRIPDLHCDYFGTSLHKWLGAPFGTGLLYVKAEKIKNLYPLFAAPEPTSDDIRKFENLGTRNSATEQAIVAALDFHKMIGTERKQNRLRYLKNYWVQKAQEIPGFRLHSPTHPDFDCGIGLFSMEGKEPLEISGPLSHKHFIHTVAIDSGGIKGIRITPNVYTLTEDLDRFIKALRIIVTS